MGNQSNDFNIGVGATWKGSGAIGSAKKDIISLSTVPDEVAKRYSKLVSVAIDARQKLASIESAISKGKGGADAERDWVAQRQKLAAVTGEILAIERQVTDESKKAAQADKDRAAAEVAAAKKKKSIADESYAVAVRDFKRQQAESRREERERARAEERIAKKRETEAAKALRAEQRANEQLEKQRIGSENAVARARRERAERDAKWQADFSAASIGGKVGMIGMVAAPYIAAAYAIERTAKATFEFVKQGARVNQVNASFENLNKTMLFAPDLIERMRIASRGTIDDMTLMSHVFTLVSGASAITTRQLAMDAPRLLEIAKAASKLNPALGDTAYMYESLAKGIKRAEFRLIDNLGLNVRVGQANKTYAASIGKVVEQLTVEERAMALRNEVMRVGAQLIAQAGGDTTSSVDSYERLTSSMINAKNALAAYFDTALASGGSLDWLSRAIQGLADDQADYNKELERTRRLQIDVDPYLKSKGIDEAALKEAAKVVAVSTLAFDASGNVVESIRRVTTEVVDQDRYYRMAVIAQRLFQSGMVDTAEEATNTAIALGWLDLTAGEVPEEFQKYLPVLSGVSEAMASLTGQTLAQADANGELVVSMSDLLKSVWEINREQRAEAGAEARNAEQGRNAIDRIREQRKRYNELTEAVKELKREMEAKTGDSFTAAMESDMLRMVQMNGKAFSYGPSSEEDRLNAQIAVAEAAKAAEDYANAQADLAGNVDTSKQAELALKVLTAKKAMMEASAAADKMNGSITEGGTGVHDYTKQLRDGLMQALYDSADAAGVGMGGLAALQGVMGKMDDDAIAAAIQLAAVTDKIALMGPAIRRAIEDGMSPTDAAKQAEELVKTFIAEMGKQPIPVPVELTTWKPERGGGELGAETALSKPISDAKTEAKNLVNYMDEELFADVKKLEMDYKDVTNASLAIDHIKNSLDIMAKGYEINVKVNYTTGAGAPPSGGGSGGTNNFPGNAGGGDYAHGSGGIVDFGAGTPATLHGREAVLTESQLNNLITNLSGSRRQSGGTGGGNITINNYNQKAAAISNALVRNVLRGRIAGYMGGA